MKYKLLRFSLLSMLVMLFGGVSSVWADDTSGTIKFGNDDVKINSASVTGNDNLGNTWTITTVGTSSFSGNKTYYQVGKSNEPATSITFTTTLAKEVNVTSLSAKFGGFNNTAGDVSLKVDNTEVGSGSLNASNDVTVESTKSETGKVLTVSVTNIAKGVKCYYISYTYNDQTDQRVKTSIVFADGYATEGMEFTTIDLPTATVKDANENTIEGAAIIWTSSNEEVATISGTQINLLKQGTSVIKATYAGDETAYRGSEKSYTLTVTETDQIANPYVYVFEKKTFDENDLTKKLKNVTWTVTTDAGYFGYDATKGQQFGSNGKPATSLKLTLSDVPGTITSVKINTSGAADIAATFGIKVGDADFKYDEATTATLTSDATADYTFAGSASGDVVISYTQTSSKAIYIKSIEIAYTEESQPEPTSFKNFSAILNNAEGTLLEESELNQGTAVNFGIAVDEEGKTIRVAADDAKAIAIVDGKYHSNHGLTNATVTIKVDGSVKVTVGNCMFGAAPTIYDGDTKVNEFERAINCYHQKPATNVTIDYYKGEATTLTIKGAGYLPYIAMESIADADVPDRAMVYFAAGEGAGLLPYGKKYEVGKEVTMPRNTTLYKEGYTLTGWSADGGTTTLAPGAKYTVSSTDDVTLTAQYQANTIALSDRTEEVTLDWQFGEANGVGVIDYQGKTGWVVTQATIGNNVVDVKMDIDATSSNSKFNNRGRNDKWAQVNSGVKLTIPSIKGASIEMQAYNEIKTTTVNGNAVTSTGSAGNWVSTTVIDSEVETAEIVLGDGSYYSYLKATLPAPEQQEEPTESVLYSWDTGTEDGGKAVASDGESVGATNASYTTIRLNGKSDFSTNTVTITLDKALTAGDKIAITAYRNKNDVDKQTGALLKFEKGETTVSTATSGKPGLEFVNIDTSDDSAADQNRGTEPNTVTLEVPTDAAGSKTITMTRAITGTNLFITKIVITTTGESGDEPVEQDVTATWDFAANCANLAPKSEGGTYTETTMASDVDGISMNIVYNGGQIKNNDNSYYVGNGVEMQIPVKNSGDVVTVVGYPGYYSYSVAGTDATEQTTVYTAKSADATKGYVPVVSTGGNNYIISISVLQKASSVGPDLVEKSIYKTDFSEWALADATNPATVVEKQTKYTNETLTFSLFQTKIIDTDDTKFANYTTLPHRTMRAEKEKGSYVTTSALGNITKVRFIHGATGNNRGWKLEAKGDGDEEWVVVSESPADPGSWCEVTTPINKKNCQLRFTNLVDKQNAYLFELEIWGEVDLAGAPLLETMTANGKTYDADDIFEMGNSGNYEATIELSSSETMPSAENPVTAVAANGEVGTITYATEEGNTIVTIPVTAENKTANYVATFIRKPILTLTFIGVDGQTVLGTQQIEKDATIGQFAYDIDKVSATKEGYKARGWFKQNYVGEKYTTTSTFTENANLYAVETEIEVASESRKYEFDLTDKFFYAEDHEAFNPSGEGFYFHDTAHGWAFKNGNKVDLLVGSKAIISIALCQYGSGTGIVVKKGEETLETLAGKAESDGSLVSYSYEGEAGTLTLEMQCGGEMYIHSVKISNIAETNYEQEGKWFFVKAGDASSFIDALDVANSTNGTDRIFIFLPNGTYDLGTAVKTAISRDNISLIGESMDGVIIKNAPPVSVEGLMSASTIHNTGDNLYIQDLTLQNDLDYYGAGSAGRANAFHDGGNKTIAKNVKLMSYQDTYLTPANKQTYWETSEIHGAVDFICGGGDIFFEKCNLVTESRKKGEKNGEATITAHQPHTAEKFGYVFNNCTVENQAATFNFGRAWGGSSGATVRPTVTYLNTTLNQPTEIRNTRFITTGMNNQSGVFHEYNSINKDGDVVSPATNVQTFTDKNGGDAQTYETILTAEQATGYTLDKVFTDWAPADYTIQVEAPAAELKDGTITWTPADNGAIAYAVFKNGTLLGITTESSFIVEAVTDTGDAASRRAEANDEYTIRAANSRGGFGEPKVVSIATGINNVKNDINNGEIYNLQGVRVNKAQKGVYIINGRKVVIK